jgi:hypothetical protein
LGALGLACLACTAKDNAAVDPGPPVVIPPIVRDVVDSGLVILDMDADVHGPGGSTGLGIPDAGPRPDAAPEIDAAVDGGGPGAACDVFAPNACGANYGCYAKFDGTGICQTKGYLPGGSNCEPNASSPDSRCMPGYVCVVGICTALCHRGLGGTECGDSIGSTCSPMGTSPTVGYCAAI